MKHLKFKCGGKKGMATHKKKTFIDCGYCIMNEFGHMNFNDGFQCRFHLLSSENFADIPTEMTTTMTQNMAEAREKQQCLSVRDFVKVM